MKGIPQRIYRERRRLAFVVILASVAGFLFYSHLPYQIAGIHVSYVAALLYGTFIGISTLLVCLIFPSFRFAMEAFAVSRLIYATAVATFPALGATTVESPFINATIVVAGGALISLVYYSNWMGRVALRHDLVSSVRLRRGASGATLYPTEEHLRRLAYAPDRKGPQQQLHELIRQTAESQGNPASGFARISLDAADGASQMRIRHAALPLRTYLSAWIDDAFGRVADATAVNAPALPAHSPEVAAAA